MINTVERLLFPISIERFLSEHYQKQWFHQKHDRDRDRYETLFTWKDLNGILTSHRLSAPRLRIYQEGSEVGRDCYGDKGDATRINRAALTGLLTRGATLIIDEVDELHGPLRPFAASLEGAFRFKVNINLYASWGKTNGFDRHWDAQDVFILQLDGKKTWEISPPTYINPIRSDPKMAVPPQRTPDAVVELNEGDLLYLPRGWWHLAYPTGGQSLHLTVSVTPVLGVDLLKWFVHTLAADELMRAPVPVSGEQSKAQQYVNKRMHHVSTGNKGTAAMLLRGLAC